MPTIGTETTNLETLYAAPAALTKADRCDRCNAQAKVRVILPSGGELLFCGHHSTAHSARLEQLAAVLHHDRADA